MIILFDNASNTWLELLLAESNNVCRITLL
jgi:hypothetical protein